MENNKFVGHLQICHYISSLPAKRTHQSFGKCSNYTVEASSSPLFEPIYIASALASPHIHSYTLQDQLNLLVVAPKSGLRLVLDSFSLYNQFTSSVFSLVYSFIDPRSPSWSDFLLLYFFSFVSSSSENADITFSHDITVEIWQMFLHLWLISLVNTLPCVIVKILLI